MQKKDFFRKNRSYILLAGGALLLLSILVGYQMGYRLTNNLTLGKIGQVTIIPPLAETSVFIDESQKIVTSRENERLEIPLSPKTHMIIVAREGYYPWKKDVSVSSDQNVELNPLFVSVNASGQIITNADPEYWTIRNSIITDPLPTRSKPKVSQDGSVKIWIEDNGIMAELGSTTQSVVQPDTTVRNVSFYKNRNDAILFSTSNGIFVIEIDKKGGQNFMPIYKGERPAFIITDPNFIYVLDGANLMQVIL